MEYELTCCICLDLYKEPITLPCSHSLCRGCLNTVANAAGDPLFLKPFNCPTCRFHVQRHHFSELKENKMLSNIVTAYRRDKDVTGSVPQMVCYVHPTEQLLLYCQSCKKAICSYCVTEVHYKYSHRVCYIEHLIEDEKESVGKLLKETDQKLQEKKAQLTKKRNAIVIEKEAAEKMCLSLMHQLKIRFSKIKSDYSQKVDATVRELTATEKAIEARAGEFKYFTTAFDSMTYQPDRHMHYKKLMYLGRELLTFSLSISMNSSLQVEHKQVPNFAVRNVDAVQQAIQALDLLVSNTNPTQELSLQELIEQGLEHENLRAVFDRAMRKWDATNVQKSQRDADIQLSEPAMCVASPASNTTTTNSTDRNSDPSAGQHASSAEGLLPAVIVTSSSEEALAPGTSLASPLELPEPSELCEKLKSTLVDFFNSLHQKQPCSAGDPAYSDSNPSSLPMELQVPSSDSSRVLLPQQALTSRQGTPVSSSFSLQSIPSCSNTLSATLALPMFLTSIPNSGQSSHDENRDTSSSPSNLSLAPNSDRPKQSSSFQPESLSSLTLDSFRTPKASASRFPASERNFLAAPMFSVGASGEERERSPKKTARRTSRKF